MKAKERQAIFMLGLLFSISPEIKPQGGLEEEIVTTLESVLGLCFQSHSNFWSF